MIYLLKFGASFVLMPGIFFLLFWGLAIYMWRKALRQAAILLGVATFIMYLFSTGLVAGRMMASLEGVWEQPADPRGEVIVMLGGGATPDTPNLGEKGNLTSSPASRLLMTYQLYQRLQVPVILSGGQVYEDSGKEAIIAQRELIRMGVPEKDVIIEPNSLNTYQNAVYSKKIMEERGWHRIVLVTSAFHMERSVLNFQKLGVDVVPCPADYMASRQQTFHYNKLMPQADSLYTSNLVLREKLRTMVTRYFNM